MSILGGVQRRLRDRRSKKLAEKQSACLPLEPGQLTVTTFYDVEGDYAFIGKQKSCFSTLHRIADLESRLGIHSTYNVVAQLAAEAPDLFRDLQKAGHEIASHSLDHQVLTRLPRSLRRASIYRAHDIFQRIGLDVAGHRSPQSSWSFPIVEDLKSIGYLWNAENDPHTVPYMLARRNERAGDCLWRMPVAMDDWWYEGSGLGPKEVLARWKSRVVAALERGGYLAIGFHPWVEELPERFSAFTEFMGWITSLSGIRLQPFRGVIHGITEHSLSEGQANKIRSKV